MLLTEVGISWEKSRSVLINFNKLSEERVLWKLEMRWLWLALMPWDWPSLAALLQFPSCTQEGGGASPLGARGSPGAWGQLKWACRQSSWFRSTAFSLTWAADWNATGGDDLVTGKPESPLESKNYFQNSVPNISSRLPAVICHTYHWAPASHLWSWESLVPCLLAGFLLVVVWTCTLAVVIPLGQLSLGSYRSICSFL